MTKTITAAIIIVGGAVAAMLVGPNGPLGGFWRPIELDPEPAGAQLAGLIGAGVVEAIGFGAAIAILVLGRPLFARLTTTPGRALAAQVTSAWLLGSWWPHTALHMHHGTDPAALVALEVGFHAGSIVAFAILLWALIPRATSTQRGASPADARNSQLSG